MSMQPNPAELYENQKKFFDDNYSVIEKYHLAPGDPKRYIGSKEAQQCRFCGKKAGDTKFGNISHAFPALIGNKTLFSHEECNDCNHSFGRSEDHFGKFLLLARTLYQIPGRTGSPSFKDKNSKISYSNQNGLEITLSKKEEDKETYKIIRDTKQLITDLNSQSYIPIEVYKSLIKMAISIMPKKYLPYFIEAIQWINTQNNNVDLLDEYAKRCYYAYAQNINNNYDGKIVSYLLERKSKYNLVPYMLYVVAFAGMFFQIVVPCPQQDPKKAQLQLHCFPLAPYTTPPYEEYICDPLDLSSKDRTKEQYELSSRYENSTNILS